MSALDEFFGDQRITGSTDLEGHHWLGVVARRSYGLRHEGMSRPIERSIPPSSEDDELCGLIEADDLAILKPFTDVFLTATIEGRRSETMIDTCLELGTLRKVARVWGRRTVEGTSEAPRLSEAEPIDGLRLGPRHAFGGWDGPEHVYPRNPRGVGYLVAGEGHADRDVRRLRALEVPQLEDPTDPVTIDRLIPAPHAAWPSRPVAAGYGPLDRLVFPRCQNLVALGIVPGSKPRELEDRSFPESSLDAPEGTLALDPRFLQCASSGLGTARLLGNERFGLRGFSRGDVRSCLPGQIPRLELTLPGVGTRTVPPALKTVLFEVDHDRVSLTWVGRLEVLFPYGEAELAAVKASVRWS